ncbi:MAG: PhnD/SsuA/transferrin family substrate-binding protein [Crocosphaera sp.]|nr:PhnD/SsuA/transferrin family substrate-binding protein [Crocosphaera sp.]
MIIKIISQTTKSQNSLPTLWLLVSITLFSPILETVINPIKVATAQVPKASITQKSKIKIGVLAKRGDEKAFKQWQATADYLTQEVPGYSFEIVPLDFEESYQAVKESAVDFIIANPGMYVDFEGLYDANRIATLKNLRLGDPYTIFGGVIFRRQDRDDIQDLKDIKGKKIMAVNKTSLGGWQMQWGELKKVGLNPWKDLKQVGFANTHDNVVYAVQKGEADVGAVRTDTLERMANEGKINLDEFVVINQKTALQKDFPFLLSTELYPEWPFAATQNTPNELSQTVAAALLRMPKDSRAAKAATAEGWTVPLNYRAVDDLFLDLQIGVYEDLGNFTFGEFIQKYWYWFSFGFVSLTAIVAIIIIYQQKRNKTALEKSAEEQRLVIIDKEKAETNFKKIAEEQQEAKEQLEQEIYQLLEELQEAVDGDLTVRANLNSMEMSTVADLFNAVIDSLQDIAIQVKNSSARVSNALGEDKQSIEQLAQQASQEAETTLKTLGSVDEMSQFIKAVAKNANQAAILANDTYGVTQEGAKAMDKTVNSIVSLKTTIAETAKKMQKLEKSSQKISQVVSLIEEMTLKTNLLAINAGRSGEQGEGFAIFGEQLALLAEQSATATREIANIISNIQRETQEVAYNMTLGTNQVNDTTQLVEATTTQLEQVLERSRSINDLMQSISEATVFQTDTAQTVTELMEEIARYSQQRLTASETVAHSMEETAQVAQELEAAVKQFKVAH